MNRTPQPGELIGERFRVMDVVGHGGMGVVYRAENIVTTKQVALKWLHPRLASGVGGERLMREARTASRLKHPNIVDVYDLIKDSASDTWILVMELLKGETLRQYMQRAQDVTLPQFIARLLPAMGAVVAAHELGIVHRDLKPENIFLERIPATDAIVPKVLDFGVAKLNEPGALTLTATGTTLGTPFYMSPEQYHGDKDIDARTDVYAFGVMLFEAITGRTPHSASSLPALALKVTTADAPPLKVLCPSVPGSLARLVDWALAREREQRIPTLRQFYEELEVFAREHSFRAEMTRADSTIPRLAVAAPTAETLASTRIGARMHSDGTLRRVAGPKQQLAWIAFSMCALILTWAIARRELPAVAVSESVRAPQLAAADTSLPVVRDCASEPRSRRPEAEELTELLPALACRTPAETQLAQREASEPARSAPVKARARRADKPGPAAPPPAPAPASKPVISELLAF